jgi:citrate lyase beta subunit
MIEKAKTLPADEVFLDLEDAVAPGRVGAVNCAGFASTTGPRRGPIPT